MIVTLNESNMLTYKFQPGDKVVPNHGNSKRYGIVIEHIDENVKVEIGEEIGKRTVYIHESKIKLYDEAEDMIKKCLFEDASALDNTTINFKNGAYIELIHNRNNITKESEEKKMKEIKNQKVVDLYFTRKKENLRKEFEISKKYIVESDDNNVFIQQLKCQLDKYIEENEIKDVEKFTFPMLPLTVESKNKHDEVYKDYYKKLKELDDTKAEILVMLSGCETYEQEMKILHSYNIVSFNTNYIKMETK